MFLKTKANNLFLIYHSFAVEIIDLSRLLDQKNHFRIVPFEFKFTELSFDIPRSGKFILFGDCKQTDGPKIFRKNFIRRKLHILNCMELDSDQVQSVCLDKNSCNMICLLEKNRPLVFNSNSSKRIMSLDANLKNELRSMFWEEQYLFLKSKRHVKIFDFKSMRVLKKFSIKFEFFKILGVTRRMSKKTILVILFTKANSRSLLKKKIRFRSVENHSIELTASRISFPDPSLI